MIVEVGHYSLVLALVLAFVQSFLPAIGAYRKDSTLMLIGYPVSIGQFSFVLLSFIALIIAYLGSDFSVLNVWQNSHSAKPLVYKFSGTWGNHEGSMLLWVLILTLFGAIIGLFGKNIPPTLRANVISVQGLISFAFILFILTTSNPFERLIPPPAEGSDLNPILQDIGLAIHPPLLYVGYVGFSISFSFAVAALIDGRIDAAWARWIRPWTLIAWIFLTLGIAMGSYWAYYELGWGGWWFWDPVENASFMPWLIGTALLHSAVVMEKRNALKVWTILLAILTFSFSLLGTFLVRSGVLTSVHAFATDPARGVFILVILSLFIGGAFILFAIRAPVLKQGGIFAPISREGALILNNLFLTAACSAVLIGTLYPLALESITGDKISVGPPFFNLTFGPLMIPLLAIIPFGQFLAWKRGDILAVCQRLYFAFGFAIVAVLISYFIQGGEKILAPIGIGLACWLMIGSLSELLWKCKFGQIKLNRVFTRLVGLPRSSFGTTFAHFGLGVTLMGVVSVTAWETEKILNMEPEQTQEIAGYQVKLIGFIEREGPNYSESIVRFALSLNDKDIQLMEPAKRFYPARQTPTTEVAITTRNFSQIFISLGDPISENSITVLLYFKPLVTLIWIGTIIMAFGGIISLTDRRLRIGAPTQSRNKLNSAVRSK